MSSRCRALGVALGASVLFAGLVHAAPARADGPTRAEHLKEAAEEFDLGRRAFLAKDFEAAAVHFETAYRDAPRAETLRLAIRARREAKQLARAATLAAIAQELYANDAATASLAKATLTDAQSALQEYEVECRPECAITAGGRVVSQADARAHRIFLDPGGHDLGISFPQGLSLAKHVEAKKGGKETLTFDAPQPPTAKPEPFGPPVMPPPSAPKPLGPAVFWLGAGVTAALGVATIASGVDATNNPGADEVRAKCAGRDESCPEYQEGKSAEARTNVLLGVTLGAAVVTGIIGLFFTQWSSSATSAPVGPRGSPVSARLRALQLDGRF